MYIQLWKPIRKIHFDRFVDKPAFLSYSFEPRMYQEFDLDDGPEQTRVKVRKPVNWDCILEFNFYFIIIEIDFIFSFTYPYFKSN